MSTTTTTTSTPLPEVAPTRFAMNQQHVMLIAIVLICGVNIYIAIQMKKRMDKADALLSDMAQVSETSLDLNRLATAIKSEPPPPPPPTPPPSTTTDSEITVVRTLPPKKRAKKQTP